MDDEEKPEVEEKKVSKTFIAAVLIIVIVCALAIYSQMSPPAYMHESHVAGIAVRSQIPLEEFEYMKKIAIVNSTGKAAITCSFELSAISQTDKNGYVIFIEDGEQGIYLQRSKAYIRGETDEEILRACNIFSCLREGIDCGEGLWKLKDYILQARRVNIIVDNDLGGSALRGYGDIAGALGYLQGEHYMEDADGDGRITKEEIEENLIKIFPYIKENNTCKLQPITTQYQRLNATNETRECDSIGPAIILQPGDENRMYLEGDRLILEGSDDAVGSGAIIIRDAISPEFIRSLYRLD